MKFTFKAKERSGRLHSGDIEAESEVEARRRLREQGMFILSLAGAGSAEATEKAATARPRGRVKQSDMVMMLSQLTIMVQSGVDLAEAIRNVAAQCPRPLLRTVLEAVHQDVSSGTSFSAALSRHASVFDRAFVAAVAAGEQSGAMVEVLQRLTTLLRNEMRLRSGIRSMLMYPLVLCGVTLLVLCAMVFFVLPQFAKVFADLDRTPPPLTHFLLSSAQLIREQIVAVVAFGLCGSVALFRLAANQRARQLWDDASLNLAVLRNATRALAAGRTFRLLGTMLQTGVPLLDGLRLCRDAARNRLFRSLFERLELAVLQGKGVSETMLAATFLPQGAAQMVAVAERSGKLASVLQSVGDYFEDEGERHLRDLVKFLEPAVIIGLGLVVALVVLSVVLPLIDVSTITN